MVGKYFKSCIDFFNITLGAYVRLRELHFNTHIQAQHNLTNDVMPAIMDYADLIMENSMGMFGRPGLDILNCKKNSSSTIKECLEALRSDALSLKLSLDKDTLSGITNVLDDMITDLNKWIYLSENK